jgi:hypothetical protein
MDVMSNMRASGPSVVPGFIGETNNSGLNVPMAIRMPITRKNWLANRRICSNNDLGNHEIGLYL